MIPSRGEWTEAHKRAAGERALRRKARLEHVPFSQSADAQAVIAEALARKGKA
jgi:hypothetical protein